MGIATPSRWERERTFHEEYVTEFIGTFFLVLTICTASGPLAPLAIGAALMVMVYMGGPISGAHYNPAVSLAVLLRGKLTAGEFVPYVVAQIVGAFAAAAVAKIITGQTTAVAPGANVGNMAALTAEILFTFALALVVLNVATASKAEGNSYYGLAIGFTVMTGAVAVGDISGGAFNPAVGIGAPLTRAIADNGSLGHIWLYVVGPCTGATAAAFVYNLQHAE